jgi:signal peptidase
MNPKLTKTFKAIKIVASAVWWCVLAIVVALLVNVIGAKMSGKVPSVFGYSVLNIVSGSMEDEIPSGSYILIKKTDAGEIEKGDVICFYSTDPKIYGLPNTHRVVEEPIVTENGIEFVTKGDANPINDKQTAKGDRIVGVYVKRLDGLTAFSDSLGQGTLVIVIICLLFSTIFMIGCAAVISASNKKSKPQDGETEE